MSLCRTTLIDIWWPFVCYYVCRYPGPRFNIKMSSYQYRKSHCGDKTILRPSYLHNGISFTGKMTHLYWIRALVPNWCQAIINHHAISIFNFQVAIPMPADALAPNGHRLSAGTVMKIISLRQSDACMHQQAMPSSVQIWFVACLAPNHYLNQCWLIVTNWEQIPVKFKSDFTPFD